MTTWTLLFDMRAPSFGTPADVLYREALAMCEWADAHGVTAIALAEHHGVDDGYLPSALTMAAAVAARTTRCFVSVSAVPLSLHDPIAVAEQIAVLSLLGPGRVSVTMVAGYVPHEHELFGLDFATRGKVLDDKLTVLRAALRGERGVTPVPSPPPLVFVGGASPAAARRAARLGDAFSPTVDDPALDEVYVHECERLGRPPGMVLHPRTPLFVHVADDPEEAWARIRPHAEHELASYRAWAAHEPNSPYAGYADADAARPDLWDVLTPEQARTHESLVLKPLLAGLDPELGWESLQLAAAAAANSHA
jgi:alkanesulfonate monooxygenase SsuD/methylene tetrahydromethanopterin reductase-like flavin-dependent oxidoreductase (luciferase family)